MSELDTSVDDLTGAVADLATRIDTPSGELAAALTRIGELNAQITALSSDDQADSDSIAELTAERDTLLSDSAENVAKIQGVTEQVRGLAPAATPEPAPEPEPEPEPAPEPVDPSA